MRSFKIYDWAGNEMNWGTFKEFEDAWGFIYDKFRHLGDDAEDEFGEYEVREFI